MLRLMCLLILTFLFTVSFGNHFKNFDDSILFSINWPGHDSKSALLESPDYEKLTLVSADQEEFQCLFPKTYGEIEDESSSYKGLGPLSLLLPALRQKSCSYKIESYWSYEVCQGSKILQYHKELENKGKKIVDQQYILGRLSAAQLQQLEAEAVTEDASSLPSPADVSETKVEGINMPYYSLRYTDGTICELSGNPRVTDVLYVCYEHGRNDIYSVKETSTCEYEIIILTDVLCQHPLYKKKEKPELPIHCLSSLPGPRRPKELIRTEAHSLKMKMMPETKLSGSPENGAMALGKIDTELAKVKATLLDNSDDDDDDEDDDDDGFGDDDGTTSRDRKPFPPRPLTRDQSAVKSFLTGEHCLDGGVGWWHYEFCYGRHVTQFHENKDGSKITILLGTFNPLKHIEWIKKHPSKAPNGLQVTHLYSDGAVCDVTGQPRVTEVRLKCYPPSEKVHVGTVALYLVEPEPCYYILGVETGLVCDLLHDADEYGLLQHHIFDQAQILKEDLDGAMENNAKDEDGEDREELPDTKAKNAPPSKTGDGLREAQETEGVSAGEAIGGTGSLSKSPKGGGIEEVPQSHKLSPHVPKSQETEGQKSKAEPKRDRTERSQDKDEL